MPKLSFLYMQIKQQRQLLYFFPQSSLAVKSLRAHLEDIWKPVCYTFDAVIFCSTRQTGINSHMKEKQIKLIQMNQIIRQAEQ